MHVMQVKLNTFFYLQGNASELPEDENTPLKRVDKIFTQMDKVSIQVFYTSI